ncbi:hypothetical protein D9M69_558940 [compost metagenome]
MLAHHNVDDASCFFRFPCVRDSLHAIENLIAYPKANQIANQVLQIPFAGNPVLLRWLVNERRQFVKASFVRPHMEATHLIALRHKSVVINFGVSLNRLTNDALEFSCKSVRCHDGFCGKPTGLTFLENPQRQISVRYVVTSARIQCLFFCHFLVAFRT